MAAQRQSEEALSEGLIAVPAEVSCFLTSTNDVDCPTSPAVDSADESLLSTIPSYSPSELLPTLSLSALDCLLDFRRHTNPASVPRRSASASQSSAHTLSSALRALAHTLAHPLPVPSLPSEVSGHALPTIVSAIPCPPPPPSSQDVEDGRRRRREEDWDELRRKVERVKGEAGKLEKEWPLDDVSAELLRGVAGNEGRRDTRKPRVDHVNAAHARGLNRDLKERQRRREQRDMRELLQAASAVQAPQDRHSR